MFEAFYFSLLFCGIFYVILKSRFFKIEELNQWIFPSVFVFKTLIGFGFVYYFLNIGFKPGQPSDVERFLNEGKELNAVFYKSPKDYFLMLFNIGDQRILAVKQMNHAFLWRSNGLKIINDTRNLIRFHSLVNFISFGFQSIHILIFGFISTSGLILLFKGLKKITFLKPITLLLILVLFPSLLFWSSGILKETFVFLGIGLLINGLFYQVNYRQKIIYLLISLCVLFLFKTYILFCIFPSLIFLFLYARLCKEQLIKSIIIFCSIVFIFFSFPGIRNSIVKSISKKQNHSYNVALPGINLRADTCFYFFKPNEFKNIKFFPKDTLALLIKPCKALYRAKQNKYPSKIIYLHPSGEKWKVKLISSGANSYFKTTPIKNDFSQLIKNIPEALSNSFFRPFPNDTGGPLKYVIIVENLTIYIFLFFAIYYRRKLISNEKRIIYSNIVFTLTLYLIIGLISCVSGEISRYRLPGELGLLIIGLILLKVKKNNSQI